MTKRPTESLEWLPVEVTDAALAKRLDGVREAEKTFRDLKAAFETQFLAMARKKKMLEPGFTLAFGYRFGKLSVAKVAEKSSAPKASGKPVIKF